MPKVLMKTKFTFFRLFRLFPPFSLFQQIRLSELPALITTNHCQITQQLLCSKLFCNLFFLRYEFSVLLLLHIFSFPSTSGCLLLPLPSVIVWHHLLEGEVASALFELISKRFFSDDTTKIAKFVLISFK